MRLSIYKNLPRFRSVDAGPHLWVLKCSTLILAKKASNSVPLTKHMGNNKHLEKEPLWQPWQNPFCSLAATVGSLTRS